jgi:hypothetical protein
MSLFKIILRNAEDDLSKNTPLQKERAALMKKNTPPASQQQKPAANKLTTTWHPSDYWKM